MESTFCTPLSPRAPSPFRFSTSASVCSTTGTPLPYVPRHGVDGYLFVAPLTMPIHVVGALPRGAKAVTPTLRTAAASSPARRARMAATYSPSPYETGAPKAAGCVGHTPPSAWGRLCAACAAATATAGDPPLDDVSRLPN